MYVLDIDVDNLECLFDVFPDRVGLARGKDKVFRLILLEHQPHALDIVTSWMRYQSWVKKKKSEQGVLTMSPITLGIDVAQVEARLLSETDICHRSRNFAGDESSSSTGALVVEQDAVAGIHAIGLAVVDDDPVSIELGDTVGGAGVEGSGLALRGFDNFSVEFGCRCLIEFDVFLETACSDCVQQPEGTQAVNVARVLGHLEGNLDMRLGAEVINFCRLDLGDDVHEVGAVAEIAIVKLELSGAFGWRYKPLEHFFSIKDILSC